MNRRLFLQLPVMGPVLAFALPPLADQRPTLPPGKGVLVRAGQDRFNKSLTYLDARFDIKVSGKDNGGRCVIFDTIRNQKVGPSLHIHDDCDDRTADAVVFCHGWRVQVSGWRGDVSVESGRFTVRADGRSARVRQNERRPGPAHANAPARRPHGRVFL